MNKMIQRLYIHVPFCSRKCDYCAFYSEPAPDQDMINAYLNQLNEEFLQNSNKCSELSSIYIGGGTPSFLSAVQLSRLFELICHYFTISPSAEISIECNPDSLTLDKISIIANFANRISLGVQSFNGEFRKTIGRSGTASAIIKALDLLSKYDFANFGCDLIYGIPGESLKDWHDELMQITAFPVRHISAYSLTYEEGSKLRKSSEYVNNDTHIDTEVSMWELCNDFLHEKGVKQYEISNYAQDSYECKHNLGIWYGDAYLGCGPAAASFDGIDRWTNASSIQK